MLFSTLRVLALGVLLSVFDVAVAAAPQTLGYQGHLADSGGNPITGDLSITFRLYDAASGGSLLWSEVQPAVQVDGGNMAVELGKVTPLPLSIWGKQLYLGIQISGDTEMLPRPPLTAAPYALRAARTMKNTIMVSAEGTPAENGTALIAAVAGISGPSASQPVAVEIDAGTYDLGTARLDIPQYVSLTGRGQDVSLITSANTQGTVLFASNTQARRFTARNTGLPPDDNNSTFGIGAATAALDSTTVSNVRFESITGESVGVSALGGRWGIYFCASNSFLANSFGSAKSGDYGIGLRADCKTADSMLIDGVTLTASDSVGGVRGAFLAGGGAWSNIKVFLDQSLTTGAAGSYGLRVFANTIDVGAAILNAVISIEGNNPGGLTTIPNIDGLRIEIGADVDVKGLFVEINKVKAMAISGVRLLADNTSTHIVHISDADIHVTGVQDAAQGPGGGIFGVRAQGSAPQLARVKIKVECLPNGYNFCGGVTQQPQPPMTGPGMQAGTLTLDQVTIETGHDAPADTSAQSVAFLGGLTPARIDHSTLRVLRSASEELQSGVNIAQGGASLVRVHNSSVEIESVNANHAAGKENCVAANGASGSIELYGGYVDGVSCTPPGPTYVCAGVTKRGAGLLAGCP
jgi:hypothetical protein